MKRVAVESAGGAGWSWCLGIHGTWEVSLLKLPRLVGWLMDSKFEQTPREVHGRGHGTQDGRYGLHRVQTYGASRPSRLNGSW
jgi:hypothetical protein